MTFVLSITYKMTSLKIANVIMRTALICWILINVIYALIQSDSLLGYSNRSVLAAIFIPETILVSIISFNLLLLKKPEMYDQYIDGIQIGDVIADLSIPKKLIGVFTILILIYSMMYLSNVDNPDEIYSYGRKYFLVDEQYNHKSISFTLYNKILLGKTQLLLSAMMLVNYMAFILADFITKLKQ